MGQKGGCLAQPAQLRAAITSHEASPYLLVAMAGPMEVTREARGGGAQSSGRGFIRHVHRASPQPAAGRRLGRASSAVSSEAASGGYQGGANHTGGFTHTVKPAGATGGRSC